VARFGFQYAMSFLKVKPAMDPVRIEFSDDAPAKPQRSCPACGKRAGVALDEMTGRPGLMRPEAQVADALERTAATHGCTRCGHRWIELGEQPQRPLRLV